MKSTGNSADEFPGADLDGRRFGAAVEGGRVGNGLGAAAVAAARGEVFRQVGEAAQRQSVGGAAAGLLAADGLAAWRGSRPKTRTPCSRTPTRQSVACFGAVALRTGKFAHSLSPAFNAVEFETFLRLLLRRRSPGRKIVVVLDNARYHHAKLLKPFLRQRADVLDLLFLPPCSPHLAPIERVWKLARRLATHNLYFKDLQALVDAVSSRPDAWNIPTPHFWNHAALFQSLCST